jgi:hypothetical protein
MTTSCWISETVGSVAVATGVRLVIDGGGKLHLATLAPNASSATSYATNESGSWVVATAPVGLHDLALDTGGTPHICTTDDGSKLIHAVRTPTGWTPETVRQFGDEFSTNVPFISFSDCTLAVTTAADVDIAFAGDVGAAGNQWYHVAHVGTAWSDPTGMQVHVEGTGGQIALAGSGAWHLVHRTSSQAHTLAYTVDGAQVSLIVDSATSAPKPGEASGRPDLVLSGAESHVAFGAAFVEGSAFDNWAHYAHGSPTTFQIEHASCAPDGSASFGLAMAGATPHIAYTSANTGHVVHATKAGSWTNEDLGAAAGDADVAVDAQGKAHVAFVKPNLDLVVMRQCP